MKKNVLLTIMMTSMAAAPSFADASQKLVYPHEIRDAIQKTYRTLLKIITNKEISKRMEAIDVKNLDSVDYDSFQRIVSKIEEEEKMKASKREDKVVDVAIEAEKNHSE